MSTETKRRKSEKRRRTAMVAARFLPEDAERLKAAAAAAGLTVSAYVGRAVAVMRQLETKPTDYDWDPITPSDLPGPRMSAKVRFAVNLSRAVTAGEIDEPTADAWWREVSAA